MMMILIEQRELDQWRKENRSLQLELRHEESLTAQVSFQTNLNTPLSIQTYADFSSPAHCCCSMLMVASTVKTTKP